MRILQFDGEPERVDDLPDAEIEAGAMQERLVDSVAGSSDIVIAVFVAEAVIETDVQPSNVVEVRP
jgi:hypothetical protein